MSVVEDLAKKYLDEVGSFLPLSCVASIALGLCLLTATHENGGSSVWFTILSERFEGYWYFRDIILNLWNWELLLVAISSIMGSVLTKRFSVILVVKGCASLHESLQGTYVRALSVAKNGGFSANEIGAAQKWREVRFRVVWGFYKLAEFMFSMTLISILVFVISLRPLDIVPIAIFMLLGFYFLFLFSARYVSAYLPERILIDADIGLLKPRVAEDI